MTGNDDDPSRPAGCAIVFAVALWATAATLLYFGLWAAAAFVAIAAAVLTAGMLDPG